MILIDLVGKKFGRWTVLSFCCQDKNKNSRWKCICECGNEALVLRWSLMSGSSKSCGCLNRDVHSALAKHGQSKRGNPTAEYTAWAHMKQRCRNPENKQYYQYGGRGITVCDRWFDSFEAFFEDMGKKPSPDHSLDRFPNNNGNYESGNCAWRTIPEQNRNKRDNRWLEYNGDSRVIVDWAKKWGVSYQCLQQRLETNTFVEIYENYEKISPDKKIKKSGIIRSDSRKIEVIENGVSIKVYPSVSITMKEENVSKIVLYSHLKSIKYFMYRDKTKNKKIPFDYSGFDKTYRYKK